MDEIEIGVLDACQEYISRQQEMLPLLGAALGVEESRVFYTWAFRRCAQRGSLAGTDWHYFFHGLECDLRNQKDRRSLRVDFGPKGRVGILNDYGVLRLIMTSVSPWGEFPHLRVFFAKDGPPFHENSGDWNKMWPVWHRLESQGFFQQADPSLVAVQGKYTTRGADGLAHINFPPNVTEQIRVDCAVAHRLQLSQRAVDFLKAHSFNGRMTIESPIADNPVVS
jgi:hypothetical protein